MVAYKEGLCQNAIVSDSLGFVSSILYQFCDCHLLLLLLDGSFDFRFQLRVEIRVRIARLSGLSELAGFLVHDEVFATLRLLLHLLNALLNVRFLCFRLLSFFFLLSLSLGLLLGLPFHGFLVHRWVKLAIDAQVTEVVLVLFIDYRRWFGSL